MDSDITPYETNAELVRAVPEEVNLRGYNLPMPIILLSPRGIPEGILVCGASPRTQSLIERIYGPVRKFGNQSYSEQDPTLILREGDYSPSFTVDRTSMTAAISGPIITVAQLKISIRYLTACAALSKTKTFVPIHGCLMSLGRVALLICGASGVGKSWISEDLAKRGGVRIVDDWALYDSASRICMFEDEPSVLRRGGSPPPTSPPWVMIEAFNGDPSSPQSRYVFIGSEVEFVRTAPTKVTHLLVIDEPYAINVQLQHERDIGVRMRSMQPRFTDEAISILGPLQSEVLTERLNTFGGTLGCRRLIGHRTSPEHYRHSLSLVNAWIDSYVY